MTDNEKRRKLVGEKLKTARGLQPRQQVSTALGVAVSTLQMWENGQRIPKDEMKIRIADYYRVPVSELFF